MMKKTLKPLNSFRFIAALLIFIYHGQGVVFPSISVPLPLALGVSFFFVLSGYVLSYNYSYIFSKYNFLKSRILKFFPLHLFTMYLWLILLTTPEHSYYYIFYNFINLFLLQAWVPLSGAVFHLNGVTWFLSVEIFFYIFFCFFSDKKIIYFVFGSLLFSLSVCIFLDIYGFKLYDPMNIAHRGEFSSLHLILHFPIMRLFEFSLGMLVGKYFNTKENKYKTKLLNYLELLSIFLIICFAYNQSNIINIFNKYKLGHVGIWISQCGCAIFFVFLIYIYSISNGFISRIISKFSYLGNLSFPMYMFHVLVINYMNKLGMPNEYTKLECSIIAIVITILVSYVWIYIKNNFRVTSV